MMSATFRLGNSACVGETRVDGDGGDRQGKQHWVGCEMVVVGCPGDASLEWEGLHIYIFVFVV